MAKHQRRQIRSDSALWIFHPKNPAARARFAKARVVLRRFRWSKEEVSAGAQRSTVTQFGPRLLKYSPLCQRLGQFEQQCRCCCCCSSPPFPSLHVVHHHARCTDVFATRPMRHTSSSLDRPKCSQECNLLTSGPFFSGGAVWPRALCRGGELQLALAAVRCWESAGLIFFQLSGRRWVIYDAATKPTPDSSSQSFDLYSILTIKVL
jgi:hypothetical protein